MNKYSLREETWSKLFSRLQLMTGIYTRDGTKLRRFMEGVFWVMRTGAQWNELPSEYGRYRSVPNGLMPGVPKASGASCWNILRRSMTASG